MDNISAEKFKEFVPYSLARRSLVSLTWVVWVLVFCILLLIFLIHRFSLQEPWILVESEDGYRGVALKRHDVNRRDVERFLDYVIPKLYSASGGNLTELSKLNGLVHNSILNSIEEEFHKSFGERKDMVRFAVVNGFKPDVMVLDKKKKFSYVEALGSIFNIANGRTSQVGVQWRALVFIVPPSSRLSASTPAGILAGNPFGLFLQQLAEQPPGTVNYDSPKPTREDLIEIEKLKNLENRKE